MRARLTEDPDGRLCLESPYSPTLVDALKQGIPRQGREWEPARKRWLFSPLYYDEMCAVLAHEQITLQDERPQATVNVVARDDPEMPAELAQAFKALFLAPDAPLVVAEASWKALSRVYHPDRPEYGNAEIALALNDAMAVIRYYLTPRDADDDIPF